MQGGIDFHTLIGESLQGYRQRPDELLAKMDTLGLDRAVVCPVRPLDYAYPSSNDYVAAARDKHPDRFFAFGRVDPRRPDVQIETARCLTELGLDGIYLHPFEDSITVTDPRVDDVVETCGTYQVPLLIEAGYPLVSDALQVADVARRCAAMIVMTNGGQLNISGLGQRNAWIALERHDNLHMTTSGVYRQDFLDAVVRELGPHKVLFGSQSPIFDQDLELQRVRLARMDQERKRKVLGGSALLLLRQATNQHRPRRGECS